MIARIGETAGKVWHVLKNSGEMSAAQLKKATGADDKTLWMALGWLAREDKLNFVQVKNILKISLKSLPGA
ncbi:MAG: winged helix-turn-helix domain-containing protein [candidate division KSB1 bacterium]|nr:winged helix-turn-helix domain-containing protein [candidate division KSB1 bacterium]MDZ7301535.1 winged helix-turn-helix domain-containing protein [candidate division KSB1 bacterium]MDZ7311049.1 winged helix-turn-helix domain-containing protein [candidate division KSB1 bacterium]